MGEFDEPALRARRAERADRLFGWLSANGTDRARLAEIMNEPLPARSGRGSSCSRARAAERHTRCRCLGCVASDHSSVRPPLFGSLVPNSRA
jgi:hypothetical protein